MLNGADRTVAWTGERTTRLFRIGTDLKNPVHPEIPSKNRATVSFWSRATTRRRTDGIVRGVVASWREIIYATLLYLLILLCAFVFQIRRILR